MRKENNRELAKQLGVSRASLCYRSKQPRKDWALTCRMEDILREHPSYGHKRLALALGVNKKRALGAMKLFGIQPYRRRGKKWRKPPCVPEYVVPNPLMSAVPLRPNHIWATDFTEILWKGKKPCLATMMDLFARTVTGFSVLANHSVHLVIGSLFSGIHKHPVPAILHSDRGGEYAGKDMRIILALLGTKRSMSRAGCPWENGYQESFCSQFKAGLGDPNGFPSPGELVYEIYRLIRSYNTDRIHSALRMPPQTFSLRYATTRFLIPSNVSQERGTCHNAIWRVKNVHCKNIGKNEKRKSKG